MRPNSERPDSGDRRPEDRLTPAPSGARSVPVTTDSEEARVHLERGRLAAFHYRFDKARRHLDAALAADPDLALASIYRGGSATESDTRRTQYFDRALALRNTVSDGERRMIDAFRLFLLHGDHDHAIEIFRELSDAYPGDVYAPAHLALRLYNVKEQYDEAAEQFERARERDPGFAPVHNWLGRALLRAGRTGEAEQALLASIRTFPEEADGHYALGGFYERQDRLDEAVRHFGRALELEPEFEEAREALARAARQEQGG